MDERKEKNNSKFSILLVSILVVLIVVGIVLGFLLLKNKKVELKYNGKDTSCDIEFNLAKDKKYPVSIKSSSNKTVDLVYTSKDLKHVGGTIVYELYDKDDKMIDKGIIHNDDDTLLATLKLDKDTKYKLRVDYFGTKKTKVKVSGKVNIKEHKDEKDGNENENEEEAKKENKEGKVILEEKYIVGI